jgi:hypothetical protein
VHVVPNGLHRLDVHGQPGGVDRQCPVGERYYGNVPAMYTPTYTGLENGQRSPAKFATCTSHAPTP